MKDSNELLSELISKNGKLIFFKNNIKIFEKGTQPTYVFLLNEGSLFFLKSRKLLKGKKILGIKELILDLPYNDTAITNSESDLYIINKATFLNSLYSNALLRGSLVKYLFTTDKNKIRIAFE
ncbi:MAG: hypothetical protein SFY32_12365 [Bacteroidota bacterium]|nr:hypothetical protein [Bacteroidota bacterium]